MGEGEDQPQKFAKVENPPGLSSDSRHPPTNMITLDALMMEIQKGHVEGASRHRELTGSISNVERQLEGVKTTAAKALCTAEETKHEMTNLRARVDALERGGGGVALHQRYAQNRGIRTWEQSNDTHNIRVRIRGGAGTQLRRLPNNMTWGKLALSYWEGSRDGNSLWGGSQSGQRRKIWKNG